MFYNEIVYTFVSYLKIIKMENLKEKFDQTVSTFNSEYAKFEEKGNKAAGVRARKSLQEVKGLAQDIRKQITESSKA